MGHDSYTILRGLDKKQSIKYKLIAKFCMKTTFI